MITHVAFEDLGSLEPALRQAGFEIEVIDACTANLPALNPCAPDLVVVLGGPIGVHQSAHYPFLDQECALLRARLAQRLPTLGICLGAQLMAAALGANVQAGPAGPELGWAPIFPTADAPSCPAISELFEPEVRVLHWHGDTFDLPVGATLLAGTAHTPHQAFSVGQFALALQFHAEVTVEGLERWYVGHALELQQARIDVRRLREDSHTYGPLLEATVDLVWRRWLSSVLPRVDTLADSRTF